MKKLILLITILLFSCQKKESKVIEKNNNKELEKGEYFEPYTKKESFVLKYKTDTLNLFYDGNQLKRVEKVFFSESYDGDGTSSYERTGYHINKENLMDANAYITDTFAVHTISDYPIKYEERLEFYRKNYKFSYMSFDGKKISNYFKRTENPSNGYMYDLLSMDILLSKVDFPIEKIPKSLYDTKIVNDEVYAGQDSLKVYEVTNTNNYKTISSSIPFRYLRDIKVVKVGSVLKYFAKISLTEGKKYINLKEIESIQVSDPREEGDRFVTAPKGLELYSNLDGGNILGRNIF
ncbi:hypothetical protein [Flavobacterium sp. ACN6]|uniref:hypothetical protein n=1 Tax=Flavobacterium sp. ACN6 TaxID=1920426 RepID=UPI000BB3E389|nr:hypothetical protein [Flavobacterium sp. ACN6]PBJ04993.1 hypothetical protein BSF42_43920 [Flavobacterium sp. ACN6]